MKRKIELILAALVMTTTLAACGSQQAKDQRQDAEYSSLKKKNHQLKKKVKQADTKSSTTESSSANSASANRDQQTLDSTQSSNGQTVTISNKDQAIAVARAKYGDHNGDWEWTCLCTQDGNYLSDGYYFVKAISRDQLAHGSMTGTAMSLEVYPDGSIKEVN